MYIYIYVLNIGKHKYYTDMSLTDRSVSLGDTNIHIT